MAASEAGRDVAYFTFGDEELMRDVNDMYKFLKDKCITVGKGPVTFASFLDRSVSDLHIFLSVCVCVCVGCIICYKYSKNSNIVKYFYY